MNTFSDGSDRKEANKLIQSHCSSFKLKFLPSMQICFEKRAGSSDKLMPKVHF